jgi:Zn-dependent oligopeptidase
MSEMIVEIDAITNQSAAPTFDNTIIPLEKSGAVLTVQCTDERAHDRHSSGDSGRGRAEASKPLRRDLPQRQALSAREELV